MGLGVTEPRAADTKGGGETPRRASWPPAPEPASSRLVGNVSESDLRRITPRHLDVLAMSVGDFIAKLHAAPGGDRRRGGKGDGRTYPSACTTRSRVDPHRPSALLCNAFLCSHSYDN